jgi:hypothetical protein
MSGGQSVSGVGVIDTSSLWAAASLLYGEKGTFSHPNRILYGNRKDYFLSLMHNIILYDELRTDFDVLELEEDWYRVPVSNIIKRLSGTVRIDPMRSDVSDSTIMFAILPIFTHKMHSGMLRSVPPATRNAFDALFYAQNMILGTPLTYGELDQATLVEMGIITEWGDGDETLIRIRRHLSTTVRTIRYSAHSKGIQTHEARPSAFCASPQRIELLRDYFDSEYLASAEQGATGFTDLFARLSLPKSGYDFSGMVSKPLSLTDLGLVIADLPTDEAIDRVLQVRNTDEAREIRRIWAGRLWGAGSHAVEGYSSNQSLQNVTAGGDVTQNHFVIGVPAGEHLQVGPQQTVKLTEELRTLILNALTRG